MGKLGMTLRDAMMADPGNLNAGFAPGPAMQPHKPGFMAPGSKGAMIAGIIGDTLASLSGGQPIFTQNLMAERQRKAQADAAEAQWGLHRQADNEDWQNRQAWQLAHPSPIIREDNAGNQIKIDPTTGEATTLYKDPTPKVNYQRVNNPDGTFTMVPIPMGGIPASTAPTAPVGRLTPLAGGAGGNASGGFPRF